MTDKEKTGCAIGLSCTDHEGASPVDPKPC